MSAAGGPLTSASTPERCPIASATREIEELAELHITAVLVKKSARLNN